MATAAELHLEVGSFVSVATTDGNGYGAVIVHIHDNRHHERSASRGFIYFSPPRPGQKCWQFDPTRGNFRQNNGTSLPEEPYMLVEEVSLTSSEFAPLF